MYINVDPNVKVIKTIIVPRYTPNKKPDAKTSGEPKP